MAPPKVTSAKYDVEKFTGHNNFTLWQVQMQDVLVSQGLGVILKGKPESMTDEDWEDYNARVLSMIRLHLGQEVLLQVYTWICPPLNVVPKEKRTKLDAKATRCVFLGYQKGVKGYRL
ncbi:unnamed protein product [Calypogeia fissa]